MSTLNLLLRVLAMYLAVSIQVTAVGGTSLGDKMSCNAPELVQSEQAHQAYNEHVCRGLDALQNGNVELARRHFFNAHRVRMHEVPNFRALHLIAVTYQPGSNERNSWLARSRGALEIWMGIRRCQDEAPGISAMLQDGLDSDSKRWVGDLMCGAIYEGLYEAKTLDAIPHDAALVTRYLAVRDGRWRN